MIVDLIRNDLGRISPAGAVRVDKLFDVERFPYVWQMTSTISAATDADVPEVLDALFPCGSVTGAPKVRATEIIRELEPYPRGIYCGCAGWWAPDRQASFNVAIRTATVDRETATASYHVGGGITWDSQTDAEFDECRAKAAVVLRPRRPFELLEALLHEGEYFLYEEHMDRLAASAEYFGVSLRIAALAKMLRRVTRAFDERAMKVRVRVALGGAFRIDAEEAPAPRRMRVGFAAAPVDRDNVFLYHKTTERRVYVDSLASRPDCDDVVLYNEAGEVTESTRANIVAEIDGRLVTPPVRCGLLPGTMRAHLLATGAIEEGVLTRADLERADSIRLINSVRKWIPATLIDR
jgi:para-aminobenzoate synthetase/4-amino-4-deoxychorismate lyase